MKSLAISHFLDHDDAPFCLPMRIANRLTTCLRVADRSQSAGSHRPEGAGDDSPLSGRLVEDELQIADLRRNLRTQTHRVGMSPVERA